jgi:hypothetical protein
MTRRRAAAALAGAVALGAAGCGGGGDKHEGLAWEGKPNVFISRNLPNDRVVIARVRNTGSRTLHLIAKDVQVRDAGGRVLKASAGFSTTFAHGLFGALQQPDPVPQAELIRLGKVVYIAAGASVPFYAAWRLTPGTKEPVVIDYGPGALAVPKATETTR